MAPCWGRRPLSWTALRTLTPRGRGWRGACRACRERRHCCTGRRVGRRVREPGWSSRWGISLRATRGPSANLMGHLCGVRAELPRGISLSPTRLQMDDGKTRRTLQPFWVSLHALAGNIATWPGTTWSQESGNCRGRPYRSPSNPSLFWYGSTLSRVETRSACRRPPLNNTPIPICIHICSRAEGRGRHRGHKQKQKQHACSCRVQRGDGQASAKRPSQARPG